MRSDQIANLHALVDVADPAALGAVERWLDGLNRQYVQHLPGEVYSVGGATVTVERTAVGQMSIAMRSGGEDAFDSIQYAADELHDVVSDGGGALIQWIELDWARSGGVGRDEPVDDVFGELDEGSRI